MMQKIKNFQFMIARFRIETLKTILFAIWIIITIVSVILNFRVKEDKIVIIRQTSNGDYVIPVQESGSKTSKENSTNLSNIDDETVHKVNFIKRYLALVYNFDKITVEEQLTKATDLMSESFYKESQKDLYELQKSVSSNAENMTQSFEVLSVTKIAPHEFDINGRISTIKLGKNYSFDYIINIKLTEAKRTKNNPWGLEVTNVKETRK